MAHKTNNKVTALALVFSVLALFFLYVLQYSVSSRVYADQPQNLPNNNPNTNFAITSITANCNGTGQVSFTGTIPSGGIVLTLMDKHLGDSGPFVPSDPLVQTTITSGTSPVNYTLNISGWTGGPHYRVDSNYNTKSESLYCTGTTPTPTNTGAPTPTNTSTPTPTSTNTPTPTRPQDPTSTPTPTPGCKEDCEPTSTPTPTLTVTPGPSDTPTPGPSATPTPGPSATPGPGPSATPGPGPSATPGPSHPQGEVLGASTLAGTGTFEDNLLNLVFVAGALLFALSARRYARELKA